MRKLLGGVECGDDGGLRYSENASYVHQAPAAAVHASGSRGLPSPQRDRIGQIRREAGRAHAEIAFGFGARSVVFDPDRLAAPCAEILHGGKVAARDRLVAKVCEIASTKRARESKVRGISTRMSAGRMHLDRRRRRISNGRGRLAGRRPGLLRRPFRRRRAPRCRKPSVQRHARFYRHSSVAHSAGSVDRSGW